MESIGLVGANLKPGLPVVGDHDRFAAGFHLAKILQRFGFELGLGNFGLHGVPLVI